MAAFSQRCWRWFAIWLMTGIGFLFLYKLDARPLQLWDESRVAVNAVWMVRTGDWLVTRADASFHEARLADLTAWQLPTSPPATGIVAHGPAAPDLWNTKPPLLIWLQTLMMHLLGPTVWAVRLPSALAGWLTVGVVLLFGWRVWGHPLPGLLAAVVLATSPGFVGEHVARSGDYDALLTLFTSAYSLALFMYSRTWQRRWLLLTWSCLALALLTKAAAALLPLLGVVLYLLLSAERRLLWQLRLWLTLVAATGPLLVFYILREHAASGYLAVTWFNDWRGRLTGQAAEIHPPWWTYIQQLLTGGLFCWMPCWLISYWLLLRRQLPAPVIFAASVSTTQLLVLTLAPARMPWYLAPMYPFVALQVAAVLWWILSKKPGKWIVARHWLLPLLLATLVVGKSVRIWYRETYVPPRDLPRAQYPHLLRQLRQTHLTPQPLLLVREAFNSSLDFYLLTLPASSAYRLHIWAAPVAQLPHHRLVTGCLPHLRTEIEQYFQTEEVASATIAPCWCLHLIQRKTIVIDSTVFER